MKSLDAHVMSLLLIFSIILMKKDRSVVLKLHTLIYCNHVWGQNYPSCLERILLIQKKLVRIITCSPFRAHTEPSYFANKILNVSDISDYIIGIFLYECLYGNIPDLFRNYFQRNVDVHDHNLRNANDLYVPYGRLDIKNLVSKLQGQIYGILLHRLLKTHNQFTYWRKIWGITKLRQKGIFKGLVNPLSSVETCMRQWKGSASVLAKACRVFGAKPSSEQTLVFYQLDHRTIGIKIWKFSSQKWIWKCHLQNARHFA